MGLQQKLINEYKKNQNIKKQILELEKQHKLNLVYKKDLEELDDLKNQLKEITYKSDSSYNEWNYLKKSMDTPSMEEIYVKDSQEDRPSELPQV
ncbi:hypothetical protein [Spiroplasma endosymbiont of Atherix ibis]|uniref:hypothetical protein n=1 Tax=Spiroplasma endosymbiont of Atherix ibis TaxID=3066291 RepID=UPI0030CD0EFB